MNLAEVLHAQRTAPRAPTALQKFKARVKLGTRMELIAYTVGGLPAEIVWLDEDIVRIEIDAVGVLTYRFCV
jgi:hypothetical protein